MYIHVWKQRYKEHSTLCYFIFARDGTSCKPIGFYLITSDLWYKYFIYSREYIII